MLIRPTLKKTRKYLDIKNVHYCESRQMKSIINTCAKKTRCSETVSESKRISCCGQSPRFFRIFSMSRVTSSPLIHAVPDVGGKKPAGVTQLSNVLCARTGRYPNRSH